jgi:branched-chain amino acid transport system substrate-binding protein
MTRNFSIVLVVALVTGCAAAQKPAVQPIRIGVPASLSGGQSALDIPQVKGMRLAVKEINAAGGIGGRPIELLERDTRYEAPTTAAVCKELASTGGVAAIAGFSDTGSALTCGPIVQKAGLPFLTPGATSPKLPAQIGGGTYLACFGDNAQAAAGAKFGAQNFGKSAYVLYDSGNEYTRLLAGYFKKSFTAAGGSIVLEDTFKGKDASFDTQISKLRALPKQPDFYYIASMPYNAGQIVKELRAAGFPGPVMGGDGFDTPVLTRMAGTSSENVFFTTHVLLDPQSLSNAIVKFVTAYKAEYGTFPENAFAALGYDTIYLIADAIKRAGTADPAAVLKAIQETPEFPGITGTISYPGGSHVPRKSVTVVSIKNGVFTLGAIMVPDNVPEP